MSPLALPTRLSTLTAPPFCGPTALQTCLSLAWRGVDGAGRAQRGWRGLWALGRMPTWFPLLARYSPLLVQEWIRRAQNCPPDRNKQQNNYHLPHSLREPLLPLTLCPSLTRPPFLPDPSLLPHAGLGWGGLLCSEGRTAGGPRSQLQATPPSLSWGLRLGTPGLTGRPTPRLWGTGVRVEGSGVFSPAALSHLVLKASLFRGQSPGEPGAPPAPGPRPPAPLRWPCPRGPCAAGGRAACRTCGAPARAASWGGWACSLACRGRGRAGGAP